MEKRIYVGKKNTISPAVGSHDLQIFFDIDVFSSETGIGVTGSDTLCITATDIGITGIGNNNFTNLKHGF